MTAAQSTSSPANAAEAADRETPARRRALLMTVARGDARFCIRLGDVSEVGRIAPLTRMDGPHDSVLGSMVLHGETVPVIDVAVAIGAVREPDDAPKMFTATRTQPVACMAFDEIVGKHESGEKDTSKQPHELIHGLVVIGGRSLPVIDVSAVMRLAHSTTFAAQEVGTAVESGPEKPL